MSVVYFSGTVRLFVIVNCSVSSFVWNVCSLLSGSVLKTRHFVHILGDCCVQNVSGVDVSTCIWS